jgi:hypothetical protein
MNKGIAIALAASVIVVSACSAFAQGGGQYIYHPPTPEPCTFSDRAEKIAHLNHILRERVRYEERIVQRLRREVQRLKRTTNDLE